MKKTAEDTPAPRPSFGRKKTVLSAGSSETLKAKTKSLFRYRGMAPFGRNRNSIQLQLFAASNVCTPVPFERPRATLGVGLPLKILEWNIIPPGAKVTNEIISQARPLLGQEKKTFRCPETILNRYGGWEGGRERPWPALDLSFTLPGKSRGERKRQ